MAKTIHPYYPPEIDIINFAANEMTVPQLLATFATGCAIILSLTWFLTSSLAPRLKGGDKAIALWFCLCKRRAVLLGEVHTDMEKAASFTCFSKATLPTTTLAWAVSKIFSVNCGRNTRCQIRDI